jgi:hypothetical protein
VSELLYLESESYKYAASFPSHSFSFYSHYFSFSPQQLYVEGVQGHQNTIHSHDMKTDKSLKDVAEIKYFGTTVTNRSLIRRRN